MGQRTPGASDPTIQPAALRQAITGPFVNLGRRNQQLLDRQLAFITHLESGETDPDRLAGLFEVDHLATRMRRNAESLFVLAEVETQRSWGRSIAVVDVVRAALGEVASYERVTIQQIEPAALGGAAASDLAHIIAELTENALRFSPDDGEVAVDGHRSRDGYVLTIVDSGNGMSVADIDEANRRLSGADRSELAPSTQLGHHIAGRLAVRHGLAVRLDAVTGNSVRATVTVPPALIAVATAPDDATELMSPEA
jgi:K+-sensing histidine kinase KdpD